MEARMGNPAMVVPGAMKALIAVSKGFFSYQIFVRAVAKPTVHNLLSETIESSDRLRDSVLKIAC